MGLESGCNTMAGAPVPIPPPAPVPRQAEKVAKPPTSTTDTSELFKILAPMVFTTPANMHVRVLYRHAGLLGAIGWGCTMPPPASSALRKGRYALYKPMEGEPRELPNLAVWVPAPAEELPNSSSHSSTD